MDVQVLLVDDEPHILAALKRLMRQARISAATASSGQEALDWLGNNHAEIILSDFRMPSLSGTELLTKIEAKWPETKRIILSGNADFDTVLQAVHSGVVHKFLAKPWSNQELIEHIQSSLSQVETEAGITPQSKQIAPPSTDLSPQASATQLQVILDTVIDGIVTIDEKGKIVSANTSIEKIFGYSKTDLIGQNVSLLMPEPYRSQHDHYLAQYKGVGLKEVVGNQRRLVGLRKNGEVFPIELSVSEINIEGQSKFLGMIRDISRRVSAESENELLIGALEMAQDGFALFGSGDKLLRFNRQFKDLYSKYGVDLSGNITYESFFRSCVEKGLFCEAQGNPEPWIEQQLALHASLPIVEQYELVPNVWIEIHETQADNGAIIVSHLNISELKQTQFSLEQAVAEANLANSARGRFLAMMSHEIRTPLNGVLGLLQLLQDTQLDPSQAKFVESALASGQGLLTIISDILDFSKIEADKLEIIPAPCNLRLLLSQLEQLLMPRVEEKSIALDFQIDPSVPDWIEIDEQRLRQILLNLLSNAIKFTDYGEVSLQVDLQSDLRLDFKVADTGIGIPWDEQGQIFSEFTTISNTQNRTYEGTGLGLSISQKLVSLLGGELQFSSVPSKGSTFGFSLAVVESVAPANSAVVTGDVRFNATVLVVDDSATNRIVVEHMLVALGLKTVCVASGAEAIAAYQPGRFQLILMDISMPDMDGYETTERLRLRDDWDCTPIIAFTAYVMPEDREKINRYDMSGYLEKPLDKKVLVQVISPLLATYKVDSSKESIGSVVADDGTELLEPDYVNQLARDTSEEVLPQLVNVFKEDVDKRLEELSNPDIDDAVLERNLHTIGSSSALYGLMTLSKKARSLEKVCREGGCVRASLLDFLVLAQQSLDCLDQFMLERKA
ncbi:response regulator [Neptuniibacter sp. QD48_55]|uniref:response regulator n=1 Tax=Neptuniibacter sp. QD48_55 TaxID=3398212 RepID=UPI0039F5A7A1